MAATKEGQDNAIVYGAMENFVAGRNRLPSTSDLKDVVELTEYRVKGALRRLEANGEIRAVHRAPKKTTVWVPSYMWEALLHHKKTPAWLDDYALDRRREIERGIRDKQEELNRLRQVEELIYTQSTTLELAISTALEILEVGSLQASFDDGDRWDFSFRLGDGFYIAEAKGKSGAASKRDVNQLGSWVEKYMEENEEADPDEIHGLLIINHYKDVRPDDRWPDNSDREPVTQHAERFLRLRDRHLFLTTLDLFDLTTQVLDESLTPAEARNDLVQRMRRSASDDG